MLNEVMDRSNMSFTAVMLAEIAHGMFGCDLQFRCVKRCAYPAEQASCGHQTGSPNADTGEWWVVQGSNL